ncbi:MAG: M15 family metallopeptidase [Cyanobacteria bacterium J06634_5]
MNRFNRLPRWLRVLLPAAFVALCVAINAIAFSEIRQSLQAKRVSEAAQSSATQNASTIDNATIDNPKAEARLDSATSSPKIEITPAISPEATLDKAIEQYRQSDGDATPANTAKARDSEAAATPDADPIVTPTTSPITTAKTTAKTTTPLVTETVNPREFGQIPKHGHLPYAVSELSQMTLIASYAEGDGQRQETLHPEAAVALLEMVAQARAEGIWLVPASGFRTIAQQRTLFNAQMAKQGSAEAAALVSAPPGYSEHHTGYAVDLTDGSLSQADDISVAFAATPAYQWLLGNAEQFNFELSFPEGNPQGISFEPWHWRYVGSPAAIAVFSPAANGQATGTVE